MRVRFYNALVMTMEEGREIFQGEIWTRDDRIEAVFEAGEIMRKGEVSSAEGNDCHEAERMSWDREIDCQGNLLMPGFKDAHTHSAMVLFRSCADDEPLQGWLEKKMVWKKKDTEDNGINENGIRKRIF